MLSFLSGDVNFIEKGSWKYREHMNLRVKTALGELNGMMLEERDRD